MIGPREATWTKICSKMFSFVWNQDHAMYTSSVLVEASRLGAWMATAGLDGECRLTTGCLGACVAAWHCRSRLGWSMRSLCSNRSVWGET